MDTEKPTVCSAVIKHPNELSYCDDDIKAIFKGTNYTVGLPSVAQLIKELRLLRICLADKVAVLDEMEAVK